MLVYLCFKEVYLNQSFMYLNETTNKEKSASAAFTQVFSHFRTKRLCEHSDT